MITLTSAQIDAWLALLLWPFFRILAILSTDPFYSSRSIPIRVRVALAFMLTLLLIPSLPTMPAVAPVSPMGILIGLQQIIIGVAIGFTMRIVFTAVEMAGHIAGLQMGLGFASFYDPQHASNVAVVAQVASLLTLLLFLALNGHLIMIETIAKSFVSLPIQAKPLAAAGFKAVVMWGGEIFRYGVLLSLPVVAALLITNLSIGVMAKAAPQLNIFAVGFPLTLTIGGAAMYFVFPGFVPHIQHLIDSANKMALRLFS
ncbi:flagellar biosynthetic protein FliR [Parachitinimonas caeni]|uniref:Flagellar biosynthetic protein FliR n=1 Tax=Parachitinimonas caeni TaxID=3031301 RepID=A0ABT7DUN6_9NEIS|nr:flagellar biosynthetic protein FliR [Parachitinimonas caeni]MDK2123783.1 flagellar biosynthetic protein FliR [Parachitinimonas caeni]